ncbi:hypothetical protein KO500_09360 [Cellulophaga baltica]|uniref:MltR family transcriptional regulator n=1 Tax=Cellulophaga TaxID=104264 RepID=UPI001C076F5A|nr:MULTISPECIES: MltR family transcriptional regulator [Cellulophaga]MBU2996643.1 hypothetical protein [Cellulophaga baltica]MDO6768037.1 MltR family transcriptional regulator [Cellulophaga sp. 1_MG-2023]
MDSDKHTLKGKEVERYFDFNQALIEFSDLFNQTETNERSIAILGGTFLEMTLEHVLYSFLPEYDKQVEKLFEFNSPLGNFSNKIQMAFCLGLIEKIVMQDLNLIRKIRNKFAHQMFVDFQDSQIESWCKGLEWHKISFMDYVPEGATNLMLFQVGVNQLISNLNGHISIARGEKRHILNNFGKKAST